MSNLHVAKVLIVFDESVKSGWWYSMAERQFPTKKKKQKQQRKREISVMP